jgi:hypothetical protein
MLEARCAQRSPKRLASRNDGQGSFFSGARKRSAPSGGVAYGMPKKLRTAPGSMRPSSSPSLIVT